MPMPPKRELQEDHDHAEPSVDRAGPLRDDRERGYYYDDSHGYEEYDPEKDDDDSGGGALDVDLDRAPPLLIEPEQTENKS